MKTEVSPFPCSVFLRRRRFARTKTVPSCKSLPLKKDYEWLKTEKWNGANPGSCRKQRREADEEKI